MQPHKTGRSAEVRVRKGNLKTAVVLVMSSSDSFFYWNHLPAYYSRLEAGWYLLTEVCLLGTNRV